MLKYFMDGLEALGYTVKDETAIGYETIQLYAEEIDDTVVPLHQLKGGLPTTPLTTWSFYYVPEGTTTCITLDLIDLRTSGAPPVIQWHCDGQPIPTPTNS